ncbi:MAG: glycosyltransferase family 2 protein [Gammaproteobacteria bacterium]|nr:glycosyltransferase family 2 protein [Gammaproteobacteria bacterium]
MVNSQSSPLISVIIPTYNRAWCIGRAINSVLNQTYQNYEIVITDDGSTDDTNKVIDSFSDNRIKYFKFEENRGMYKAQCNSIEKSTGDYIIFLDSDDELVQNAVQSFVSKISILTDKVAIILANQKDTSTNSNKGNSWIFNGKTILHYDDIICKPFIGDFLPFVRRDVFQRIPYKVTSQYMTNIIWHKIFREFSFYYLAETLGIVHTDSTDRRTYNRAKNADGWVIGVNEYLSEFGEDIKSRCPSHLAFIYRILAMYQILAGERVAAIKSILQALKYNLLDWKVWVVLGCVFIPKRITAWLLL